MRGRFLSVFRLFPIIAFVAFVPLLVRAETSATFSIPARVLDERVEAWKNGDAAVKPAVERLMADTDKLLGLKPASVMDKKLVPPGGDKHDYYSFGIYWWPDPEKSDGLPYIRKDGQRNPAAREGNDGDAFSKTNHAVATLGLAYRFGGNEAHAAKAAELARVWYLNPETRMNSNMNFAQAVPGRSDGRSVGLIEAESLPDLMDGIALIRSSVAWTEDDDKRMTEWLAEFYRWLRTSENGLGQEKAKNNHGTYYDALAVHLALYLGKKDEAQERLEQALVRRLDAQIQQDGKQPHELARTISFNYSIFNLKAFFQLATLSEGVGPDWWKHRGPKGENLKAALDLLVPHVDPDKEWKLGKQIKKVDGRAILPLLQQALRYGDDAEYRRVLEKYGDPERSERWRLTQ